MSTATAVRGDTRTALHGAARAYAAHGWAVCPLQPCAKTPATRNGCKDATVDLERVDRWWSAHGYNIGIATGAASGLVVVDLDGRRGFDSWITLDDLHGPVAPTAWCFTGSGGWHAYFTHPGGLRNSASKIAAGVDIRGDGGYVVAPPSIHPNGEPYTWHTRLEPAPLPEWLELLINPPRPARHDWTPPVGGSSAYAKAAVRAEAHAVAHAPAGGRNDRLVRAAFSLGTLVGAGDLDADDASDALLDAARACGLPDREAQNTVRSGLTAGAANPRNRR